MTHPFMLTADEAADVLNRTYADLAQRRHRGQSPHAQREPSGRVWYPVESVLAHVLERAEQVVRARRPVFDSHGRRLPPPPASYTDALRARIAERAEQAEPV